MIEKLKRYHPGVYIKDSLDALNMSNKEFSLRTGISERTLSAVINGNGDITFDIASKLSEFFGNSINFWTNLQNAYDSYILQEEEEREVENDYQLIKSYRKYLVENDVINEDDDKKEMVSKTRNKLSINHISYLNSPELLVSFKEAKEFSLCKKVKRLICNLLLIFSTNVL